MADAPDTSPKAGEKRSATVRDEAKKPPKLRRFDMKTRVPKRNTESGSSKASADVLQKNDTFGETQTRDSAQERMSVNAMFRTSFELQQAEGSGTSMKDSDSGHQGDTDKNIVDKLFQDFVAVKMKGVDQAYEGDGEKDTVSSSMEEINRLLDAEITSIQSRSVVSQLYDDNSDDGNDARVEHESSKDQDSGAYISNTTGDDSGSGSVEQSGTFSSHSSLPTTSLSEAGSQAAKDGEATRSVTKSGDAGNSSDLSGMFEDVGTVAAGAPLPAKKPLLGIKKLGLSIGQESLARIMGNWKNGKILEEGEVASTDSEAEKKSKAEDSEESDNDISGTGSISDAEDKAEGKESKSKKKKKHKHKHKKKKKHKSHKDREGKDREGKDREGKDREGKDREGKDREGKDKDGQSVERKPSKEREQDGKKESKSKDKKKHRHRSRSNSKSSQRSKKAESDAAPESQSQPCPPSDSNTEKKPDEDVDPWDARNYTADGNLKTPPRAHSKDKDRSRDRSKERSQERSKERSRHKSKERSRRKSRDPSQDRDRRRSRSRHKDKKDRDRGKDRGDGTGSDLRVRIDKNKLRKIAIARALANMEKGQGPAVDLTVAKSGGKSVAELTEFCKRISERDKERGLIDSSDSSEEGQDSDAEDTPLHHPFKMRDPSTLPNIVMNIRNAKQLPVLTPQEKQTQSAQLRTQFPVSSGTQHRTKELEWVPVTPTTASTTTTKAKTTTAAPVTATAPTTTLAIPGPVPSSVVVEAVAPAVVATTPPVVPAPPPEHSVFPAPQPEINIGSIITERIKAMRQLEQNPFDVQALTSVHKINEKANAWAQSKQLPGQFTGRSDIRILSQQELAGPDKRNQAWARKDQFRNAPPVQGGIGMFLLQKMGWKPGDGLGKDNEGHRLPLMLDIKMDRKGLTASQEQRPQQMSGRPLPGPGPAAAPRAKDLSGKHPVSALTELCTKRRWGAPNFDLVSETGPAHKKMFLFKVIVNGVEYIPAAACGNKKLAKAQAAAVCLQEMGLIPRDYVVQL